MATVQEITHPEVAGLGRLLSVRETCLADSRRYLAIAYPTPLYPGLAAIRSLSPTEQMEADGGRVGPPTTPAGRRAWCSCRSARWCPKLWMPSRAGRGEG